MQEFPEIITNPEVVRELIRDSIVGMGYPLFGTRFKSVGEAKDLRNILYLSGESAMGAKVRTTFFGNRFSDWVTWPHVSSFTEEIKPSKVNIQDYASCLNDKAKRTYFGMGWELGNQLNKKFFEEIKNQSVTSHEINDISKNFIKWSENVVDVLNDIDKLCNQVKMRRWCKLDALFVDIENYHEFWDHVETADEDLENRKRIYSICDTAAYLDDSKIWLIGVKDSVIPEGSMVGICSLRDNSLVEILTGIDPLFGKQEEYYDDPISSLKSNIPLNVNIIKGANEFLEEKDPTIKDVVTIETWLDFKVNVKKPCGAFYLENVI